MVFIHLQNREEAVGLRHAAEFANRPDRLEADQASRILRPGEYWVEGDFAAASTDSRQFGPVPADALKAKVVLVYWPKDRRRRVR